MAHDSHERLTFQDPLRPVPPSRHPFQFLVMFALGLSGFFVVLSDAPPGSINSLLPHWAVNGWGTLMMIGGSLAIASSFWRDRITGLLLERIALMMIGGVCTVYAAAVWIVYEGDNGPLNTLLFLAVGLACGWRTRHIRRELKRLSLWIGRRG